MLLGAPLQAHREDEPQVMRHLDRARNGGLVSSVAILADVLEPTYIDLAKRCTVAEATTPGTRSGAARKRRVARPASAARMRPLASRAKSRA